MNRVGDSAEPGARLINDFKDPVERTRDPTGYSGRCRYSLACFNPIPAGGGGQFYPPL